jgi:hypothetical protein
MNHDKVTQLAKRLAAIIAEPGSGSFGEWASAVVLTSVSMAQFANATKEEFLLAVAATWDQWADPPVLDEDDLH